MDPSAETLRQLRERRTIRINDFTLEGSSTIALVDIALTNIVCLFYSLE
jgi:hypothetical protein